MQQAIQHFETEVAGNRVTLLHDGAQCFPAMLEAIASARHEILLEMYWFGSDATGWRFAEALVRRAREGLRVRVLYDAVGSWEASPALFEAMQDAGCEVLEYNPIAPWRRRFHLGVINNRNHRKMLVVDGRIGFTGGVNLGDPWAPLDEGGGGWRDDCIRIEGPAVEQMRRLFRHAWGEVTRSPRRASIPPSELSSFIQGTPGNTPVRVHANHYLGERRAVRRVYLANIRHARRRIYIANSYFVPDRVVRRALAAAVARGVDVRVLVPGECDVPAVKYAMQRDYDWLVRHGIQVYEWQGPILHSKSAVIDGTWCAVGSYNLDSRSWRFNLEIIVSVIDRHVGQAMEERFLDDLRNSQRIELDTWRFRPLSQRALERFFHLFRRFL